jgi:hypothetical protein
MALYWPLYVSVYDIYVNIVRPGADVFILFQPSLIYLLLMGMKLHMRIL